MKRINHNDLIPWFTQNHADLPPGYLKSCQEFFDSLQASSSKPQASSSKQVTSGPECDIIKTEREIKK